MIQSRLACFPGSIYDPESDTPLYRQIYEKIRSAIASGSVARGRETAPHTRIG
jgi:DNA-binding transcriptional regulator YhcF (GntR family)